MTFEEVLRRLYDQAYVKFTEEDAMNKCPGCGIPVTWPDYCSFSCKARAGQAQEKPVRPAPAVGQVWRTAIPGYPSKEFTLRAFNDPYWCTHSSTAWRPESFTDGTLEFVVGFVEPTAAPPVDWSVYLPKEPLPDTGPKEFRAGQVWADHGGMSHPGVWRIVAVGDDRTAKAEWLAGTVASAIRGESRVARCSVLVQDVNESRPRPVERVFGKASTKRIAYGSPESAEWYTKPFLGQPPVSPWVDMPHHTGPGHKGRSPEGISAAQVTDWAKPRREPWRRGESEQPTGVTEAELERLAAGPWRRRK